jgi:hypothetical protein
MAAPGAGDRRVRLGVWAGFELPELGLAAAEPVERRLDAVYYDTADLRLLRRGVTVRREAGGWSVRRGSEVLVSAPGGETRRPRSPRSRSGGRSASRSPPSRGS